MSQPLPTHLLPARRFATDQRRHFMLCVACPTLLTLMGPLWLPAGWLTWRWAGLALGMWWAVGCLGVSVGFHRLFAHRSFSVAAWLRYTLGALGSMAGQGSVVYWVAIHRCHHALSDQPGDPHSPNPAARPNHGKLRALWMGHVGWSWRHDVPKPKRYAAELVADATAQRLSRQYWLWVSAGYAIPALLGFVLAEGWQGFVIGAWWGGALRLALGHQVIWSINSIGHWLGARPTRTQDQSANNAWLSLISWGESWHNNHHADPTSARLGWHWWQVDVGWWCIQAMQAAGWATRLRSRDSSLT